MASDIARKMVCTYGMSERFGFQAFNEPNQFATQDLPPAFSEETSRAIDAEVSKMVADAYSRAESLLAENREKVEKLARALLEKETMDGRDVEILVNGEPARTEDGGIQTADGEETQATGSEA
jgi:cell division protease FtsH